MTTLPNPWLSASAAVVMPVADQAAAPSPQPPGGAAANQSPMAAEVIEEAPAVPQTSVCATDFHDAATIAVALEPLPAEGRFVLDEFAFMEAIEPLPLFLQAPVDAIEILARHA